MTKIARIAMIAMVANPKVDVFCYCFACEGMLT